MPKGVYASASAMLAEARALEAAAANLANVQSSGYRRQIVVRGGFDQALAAQGRRGDIGGDGGAGIRAVGNARIFTEGEFDITDNPLDLALQGGGFFRVRDGEGRSLLTRSGSFQLDAQRRISTADGWLVEGQSGPISVPEDAQSIRVDGGGRIYAEVAQPNGSVESRFIDQLRIARIDQPERLVEHNGQYFHAPENSEDAVSAQVRQGAVERANVNAVSELVDLIAIQRRYEAAQRAMRQQEEAGRGFSDVLRGA